VQIIHARSLLGDPGTPQAFQAVRGKSAVPYSKGREGKACGREILLNHRVEDIYGQACITLADHHLPGEEETEKAAKGHDSSPGRRAGN